MKTLILLWSLRIHLLDFTSAFFKILRMGFAIKALVVLGIGAGSVSAQWPDWNNEACAVSFPFPSFSYLSTFPS